MDKVQHLRKYKIQHLELLYFFKFILVQSDTLKKSNAYEFDFRKAFYDNR